MNHVHFVLFHLVHIVDELVSMLHLFDSFVRFLLFFLKLNDSGTNHNLLILSLLLGVDCLHHLSVAARSNRWESGHQSLPLLSASSSSEHWATPFGKARCSSLVENTTLSLRWRLLVLIRSGSCGLSLIDISWLGDLMSNLDLFLLNFLIFDWCGHLFLYLFGHVFGLIWSVSY